MYWSETQIKEWASYISSIVGEESPEGGLLIAEKTDSVDVSMAGSKDELLQLLAASAYNFSKIYSMAFEDVMSEIADTWTKMREQKGQAVFGDEVIDMQTGIGFNDKTGMVSFPSIPKEIEEELMDRFKKSFAKVEKINERLHNEEDIMDFLNECTNVGNNTVDEETGEKEMMFEFEGEWYAYNPNTPGILTCYYDTGTSIEILEEPEVFREVVIRLMEKYARN